ncbi:MAG: enoyl-CoA hydratase/isomerase family protein [Ignavibacteriaceae bacterium]|nr:enoyl-CoA hydratase/isomerase family protein [Ignavibacteriaceae bacterium]
MITVHNENGIFILKLNRPEKRNALHPTMISQIITTIKKITHEEETKALVFSGEGSAFCAGADLEHLHSLLDESTVVNEKDSELLAEFFLTIYKLPFPTIAAVNGPAIAGGCGLTTVCDFVFADKQNAKFGFSEVSIGFSPAIVAIFLINKIGFNRAKRLLLTSEIVSAEEAKGVGLADFISENSLNDAVEFAKKLSKNSKSSFTNTKQMLQSIRNLNIDEAVNYCLELNAISRSSEDFKDRIKKFLSKG